MFANETAFAFDKKILNAAASCSSSRCRFSSLKIDPLPSTSNRTTSILAQNAADLSNK
jgi:hypothetical protein